MSLAEARELVAGTLPSVKSAGVVLSKRYKTPVIYSTTNPVVANATHYLDLPSKTINH